jgi:hypothetical protein
MAGLEFLLACKQGATANMKMLGAARLTMVVACAEGSG